MYSRESSMRGQRRRIPSFSSSLLDAIYRSIDDESTGGDGHGEFSLYREITTTTTTTTTTAMRKKQSTTFEEEDGHDHDVSSLRRAIMLEEWTEKQRIKKTSRVLFNSASNSSDSSSGGGTFSSSETESSNYRARSTPSCFTPIRSKPFRTRGSARLDDQSEKQPKHDKGGSFTKTKLRALKIYADLKKSKEHPISPGRRIASFLNSLFNIKKEKFCSVEAMEEDTISQKKSKSKLTTPCSSASSFSRSCLSKAPSSTGKQSNGGAKSSVRFYPVSVIVDEDCRPGGQKLVSATPFLREALKSNVEQARDILRGYQEKKSKYGIEVREFLGNGGDGDEDEEEDDDAESYASSDLFEIENTIGIGRYTEELPVYETTNLKTNQAIVHGLIL